MCPRADSKQKQISANAEKPRKWTAIFLHRRTGVRNVAVVSAATVRGARHVAKWIAGENWILEQITRINKEKQEESV